MTHWNVQLLGIPTAHRDHHTVHLRSKITWAVLASLLLDTPPPRLSRTALAEQFWEDKDEPRTHLRQAIQSLKSNFDEEAFRIDRDTIQAVPGFFRTDIGEMMRLYQEAEESSDNETRLYLLREAEGKIGGAFLEECLSPLDAGGNWYIGVSVGVDTKITRVLLALVEAYRETGNLNGAFDIALRLLTLYPDHSTGKQLAWELATETGQENALEVLESVQEYRIALPRVTELERKGKSLTSREARLFESLFEERLKALPAALKTSLASLAVFSPPFSAPLARAVCHVPQTALTSLVDADLLQLREGRYSLPHAIRRYLWRQVSPLDKRTLDHNLNEICSEWVTEQACGHSHSAPIFASVEEAGPYAELVLEARFSSPMTAQTHYFLICLSTTGLWKLLPSHLPHLKSIAQDENVSSLLRLDIARLVGKILCREHKFPEADQWFDLALTLVPLPLQEERNRSLFDKARSAHYGVDSEEAVSCLQEIIVTASAEGVIGQLAPAHRFLCEVLNHLQKYEEALVHVETAYSLYLTLDVGAATLADTRFWQGKTLLKLNRREEAEVYINEALELWQEVSDKTGVGHCLRTIAGLQMEQKRFAQAQANLDHAISLHQQTGNEGCRIAAVEVLSELCFRRGRSEEHRHHLLDCLAYYEAQGRETKVAHLRSLLEALSPSSV